jgi:hypothetical protein
MDQTSLGRRLPKGKSRHPENENNHQTQRQFRLVHRRPSLGLYLLQEFIFD